MMSECTFTKNWWIAAIAVFAFTMGFDWYVHGTLLMDTYKSTAHLWRPESAMKEMANWCYARHAVTAALLVCGYSWWRAGQTLGKVGSDNCPYKKSIFCYGLWVGLLLGVAAAGAYIYLPISAKLAQWWFGAEVVKGMGVGFVLNFVHTKLGK